MPRRRAKKFAANKPTVKKPAVKKPAVKKPAVKKPAVKKPSIKGLRTPPLGFWRSAGGLYIPGTSRDVVPPGKLQAGLASARAQIQKSLEEIGSVMTQDFELFEIELSASFNADGKFMGFGVGGAATITMRIRPSKN